MPPPVPEATRRAVIDTWLRLVTFRDIAASTGVSLGTVSNIIEEEKKRAPDLESLRQLSNDLSKAKANIADALRGAQLLSTIDASTLSAVNLPEFIKFYAQTGDSAPQAIAAGYQGIQLHATTGLSYPDLISEIQNKTQTMNQLWQSITTLQVQHRQLRSELPDLERLKNLDEKIRKKNISYEQLDTFIERASKLETLGFTEAEVEILAQELSKIGLTPAKAVGKLASLFSEHQTLQESAGKLRLEVQRLTETKTRLDFEIENRKEQKNELDKQLADMRSSIKREEELQKNTKSQLEREYEERKRELDKEILELSTTKNQLEKDCLNLKETYPDISAIESSLERLEKRLASMDELNLIEKIVKNPERTDIKPLAVMKTASALTTSLKRYAANPQYGLRKLDDIKARLEELEKELTGWVQSANSGST